jgi:Ca2+-binding RTX toxin-like protein
MTTYTATSTSALLADLNAAGSGDTILLAPGTYSNVQITNLAKSGVTVTSADPTNEAVLTDLTVKGSSGLTFSDLELYATKDMPFQILAGSSNITLDSLNVHGTLDGTSSDDVRGMLIRDSSNITVSNSYFHELTDALNHLNDNNITFTGNRFDLIRDDGIFGGGSSNVTISNNVFTDFDHTGTVHPDAIQFYTNTTPGSTVATLPASNITVTGNVFDRGSGVAVQGIWINDDSGQQPYQNLTVTNNTIIGATYNGLVVYGAVNATITGNVVIGETDQNSWLGVVNVANAYVADNIATAYNESNSNITGGGDVITSYLATTDAATYASTLYGEMQPGTLTAGSSSEASSQALGYVNEIGFVDGPSPTGATYHFGVVNIYGTDGADRLTAFAYGSSHLYGGAGNDSLAGGTDGIASILEGGPGDDNYTIYQPNDVVIEQPGGGNDAVYTYVNYTLPANVEKMFAMAAGLTLYSNAAGGALAAAAGGDTLIGGGGADTLQGGSGNDVLIGGSGSGNARLIGNDGNDYLQVYTGNNSLLGGNGNDTLIAGAGNDTLEGDAGADLMVSGGGATIFLYRATDFAAGLAASEDTISGFNHAKGDIINLGGVDANTNTTAIDTFKWIGTAQFDGTPGELRYQADGDGITVYGDTTGSGVANIAIHLSGLTTIASNSFVL